MHLSINLINLNLIIISDGGCTCPGDVAKAFGAGADFVMMGGMLAGHDQSGGEVGLDNLSRIFDPTTDLVAILDNLSRTSADLVAGD